MLVIETNSTSIVYLFIIFFFSPKQFRKKQHRFKSVLDGSQGVGVTFIPNSSSPVPFNSTLDQVNLSSRLILEQFQLSFETNLYCSESSLKNLRQSLKQSDAKLKPTTTWSPAFSRARGSLLELRVLSGS